MKKHIPQSKTEFASMLKQEYGYSDKLATDCAAIVAGYGAFLKEGKSWNGKKRCFKIIARMPYHKTDKPQCKLPCLPESNYCRLHSKEPSIETKKLIDKITKNNELIETLEFVSAVLENIIEDRGVTRIEAEDALKSCHAALAAAKGGE